MNAEELQTRVKARAQKMGDQYFVYYFPDYAPQEWNGETLIPIAHKLWDRKPFRRREKQ